jgi:hypothetical protein
MGFENKERTYKKILSVSFFKTKITCKITYIILYFKHLTQSLF